MVMGVGHAIAFHIDASGEDQTQDAGSREGIWWLPNGTANDYLVLMNRGQKPLQLSLSLFDARGKASIQNLTIAPSGMVRLSVRQLVTAANLAGSYGGIKVSTVTHAGSLDTLHVLFDQNAGFSAVMKMFDYDPRAQIKERDYAGTGQWTLRAPMLALSSPDPALAFPVGTILQPQLFVRNTRSKPINASLTFNWRSDSASGKSPGPALQLNPYETRRIDVAALQDGKTLPQNAQWTSVTLATSGLPDEVVAVAASYDQSLHYGAQTPFSDQLAFHWAGSMWQYDPQHDSIITVGNGGTKPTQAAFTLFYNQGTQKYEMEQTLQPDQQMWIDVGKLIRENVPDKNGKSLPSDLTSGSYEIRDLTHKGIGTLFEGKVVYDKTYGHVTYGCGECCGYKTIANWWEPLGIPFQGTADQGVNGLDSCSRTWQDISGDFYGNWSTGNSAIATVDFYATHTGVAVGSTRSSSWGFDQGYINNWHCPIETFYPGGGDNVQSVTVTLNPATVLPGGQSTVTVTLQPAASGISVSISISGSLYSGGHQHSARPTGTASSYSGTTDSNGQWTTQYTASAFGGADTIAGIWGTMVDQKTITIAVPGLASLGGGSNYSLVGSTTTHPSNHYGTPTANSDLVNIANQYAAAFPGGSLNYNDQSLIQGGLFDINTDWATPHVEHRLGINCDVSEANIPAANRATLTAIFTNNGSPNYLDEGTHWHLRFGAAGNPPGD
jgi:hypothetical protein